jgi:hypothetical protein
MKSNGLWNLPNGHTVLVPPALPTCFLPPNLRPYASFLPPVYLRAKDLAPILGFIPPTILPTIQTESRAIMPQIPICSAYSCLRSTPQNLNFLPTNAQC